MAIATSNQDLQTISKTSKKLVIYFTAYDFSEQLVRKPNPMLIKHMFYDDGTHATPNVLYYTMLWQII